MRQLRAVAFSRRSVVCAWANGFMVFAWMRFLSPICPLASSPQGGLWRLGISWSAFLTSDQCVFYSCILGEMRILPISAYWFVFSFNLVSANFRIYFLRPTTYLEKLRLPQYLETNPEALKSTNSTDNWHPLVDR